MFQIRRDRDERGGTAVLEALAHRRRRSVLRLLAPAGRLHFDDLVGYLSAAGRDQHQYGPPSVDPNQLRVDLRHRHLPKLVDVGLIRWSGGFVETTDDPVLEDPVLQDLLAVEADDWDEVLDCLADPVRRATCETLASRDGALDLPVLAYELVERDDLGHHDVDAVTRELHHVHLPKLADADLVAVERGGTSVRYLGHPDLESVTDGGRPQPRRELSH